MYLIGTYIDTSSVEGKGLFAASYVPKGTIVYFYGQKDEYYSKLELSGFSAEKRDRILKYGVENEFGNWNLTCISGLPVDINHCCDSNLLSLYVDGMYCDIAVKNINKNEEITIDYRMFFSSFPWTMECKCNSPLCEGIMGSGFKISCETQDLWYKRLSEAIKFLFEVKQPIFSVNDEEARRLTQAIFAKKEPEIFPFIKFSLNSNKLLI